MRSQIDIENLKNTINFYEFISQDDSDLEDGRTYSSYEFFNQRPYMEDNIDKWEYNKRRIYELMGNKTKIKIPLKEEDLFSSNLANRERNNFIEKYGEQFNLLIVYLLKSISVKEIYKNQLKSDIQVLDKKLRKGWKISKCLSELESDPKRLAEQQDLLSILIQSLKIQGQLVLSIDPLDFYTMSVSRSGWSSCHHPNSMYGTGGLAYMVDDVTMMAYIETSDPINISVVYEDEKVDIEFPNKIWRQLITVQEDFEYALFLSEYPNNSEAFNAAAAREFTKLIDKHTDSSYIVEKMDDFQYFSEFQVADYYNLEGYTFYCDYVNSNMGGALKICYPKRYGSIDIIDNMLAAEEIEPITVGEEFYCACGCGDVNYTARAYIEEACDYGDDDHYGNYY